MEDDKYSENLGSSLWLTGDFTNDAPFEETALEFRLDLSNTTGEEDRFVKFGSVKTGKMDSNPEFPLLTNALAFDIDAYKVRVL